jgi:hypothetical protein
MDPLSISVSCITLITTISRVTVAVTSFIREVRDARGDLDAISWELFSLRTVLDLLAEDTEGPHSEKLPERLRDQILDILKNCNRVVADVQSSLQKHNTSRLGRAGHWTMGGGKGDMMKFRSSLETHKTALGIALDMVAIRITRDIKIDTEEIRKDTAAIKTIKDDTTLILEEIARLQARLPATTLKDQSDFMLNRYLDDLSSCAELMSIAPEEDHVDDLVIATSDPDVMLLMEFISNRIPSEDDDSATPASADWSEDDRSRRLSEKERLSRAWRHQKKFGKHQKIEAEVVEREPNFEGTNGNTIAQDTLLRPTVARASRRRSPYSSDFDEDSAVRRVAYGRASRRRAKTRTEAERLEATKKATDNNTKGTLPVEPTVLSHGHSTSSFKQRYRHTELGFVEIGSSDSQEERDRYERAYKRRSRDVEKAAKEEHAKRATEHKNGNSRGDTRTSSPEFDFRDRLDKHYLPWK